MTVTLNVDRLAAAIRYIDGNPVRWNQGAWGTAFLPLSAALEIDPDPFYTDELSDLTGEEPRVFLGDLGVEATPACQTAFCVAGWVTHQAQHVDKLPVREHWNNARTVLYDVEINGQSHQPGDAAKELLIDLGDAGDRYALEDDEEYKLAENASVLLSNMFAGDNSRLDVQRFAENFARLAGKEWPVPMPEWADNRTYWGWKQQEDGSWREAN